MKLRFKKLQDVPNPVRASEKAAAWDFFVATKAYLRELNGALKPIPESNACTGDLIKYGTGIALEIPDGHVGLAFARSSVCKLPLFLANGTGVIDADYRGELSFIYKILDPVAARTKSYRVGERCGQLMVIKQEELEFEQVEELSDTARGQGGYGSTGKN
jgi:dUTP pyrophosphatase